ncbi:MAG: DNA polymerase [bacterium]|nr:DNA polymerase [bacterium]
MNKTLLLIDANALIHRAYHALPPMTNKEGKPTHALYGVASIMLKVWREDRPDYAVALFDRPEPTFRKNEYEKYKAHRPKADDELIFQIIEAHNLFKAFNIPAFEIPGFEADDLIGTLVDRFKNTKDLIITILTGDLDTLQLVVGDKIVVKVLKTGVSTTEIYNEEAVEKRYGLPPKTLPDYKTLVGDASDNIPGIAGVGPKTASHLLQKYGTLESLISSIHEEPKYKEKFKNQEDNIKLFKRLVLIRRDAPLPQIEIEELKTYQAPEQLIEYFDKFGFESLKKRFMGEARAPRFQNKKTESLPTQGLFGENVVEEKVTLPPFVVILKEEELDKINNTDLDTSKIKVGFNLKEIIKKTDSTHTNFYGPYFDLGVGFWVCYPDFKNYSPQDISKKFLDIEWSGSDRDYITAYNVLENEIARENLKKVFEKIEMPLLRVLSKMEERGILIDRDKLNEFKNKIQIDIRSCEDEIYKIAGEKFNLNSNNELGNLLFKKLNLGANKTKKTPKGKLSTDEEVLSGLVNEHSIVPLILSYRELYKLLSTYIKPILDLCSKDGRLRTTFVQTGTATGRLSSQNPNLQNIPIGNVLANKLRQTFVPTKGFSFVSFDYSQLELRILAMLTEDTKMIEAFKRGDDIHAITASTVLRVPLKEVTAEMRRLAKTLNFGMIYGMGFRAFAKSAGIKAEEAKIFIANYFKEFSAVRDWQSRIKEEARTTGIVRNLNGRLRRLPALNFGALREISEAERAALNMPVQSLGADIIKLAMIQVFEVLKDESFKENVFLLLSIHDELLFEVRSDMINTVTERIQGIMEKVFVGKVSLAINVKHGENWAELFENKKSKDD